MENRDWLQRGMVLFTGVYLYSFMTFFSSYVRSEVPSFLLFVLIVTCLLEMWNKGRHWVRYVAELTFIFAVLLVYLGWRPVLPADYTWAGFYDAFTEMAVTLDVIGPYVFLLAGTWALYIFLVRWFESKWRTIITVITSAVILTSIDTFTASDLWADVVLMVSAMVMLLVVQHFRMMQKKTPEGWEHLRDYPETVIVPLVLFFTVVGTVSIFAQEDISPILTDPYTAWMNYQGEEVRVTRYTEQGDSVSVGSTPATSGYGRDDSELGGPFDFDYSLIMTVNTTNPTYYRGETRDYYDGSGWSETDEETLEEFPVILNEEIELAGDASANNEQLETMEVRQSVNFSQNAAYIENILFSGYQPSRIEILSKQDRSGETEQEMMDTDGGTLNWSPENEDLYYENDDSIFPLAYVITAEVPLLDEEALRTAPLPESEEWERYLQMPDEFPQEVIDLAEEIAAEYENPYDQVKAIETYLRETYEYTHEPDESQGEHEDFVARFLFEVEEGYCDYYSTAMVMMARALDVPARWVKGFTQGSRIDEIENYSMQYLERDQGPGNYQVSNANAHSWAELYFEGYGWLTFEATATINAPAYMTEEARERSEAEEPVFEIEETQEEAVSTTWITPFERFLLVLMLTASAYLLWTNRVRILPFFRNKNQRTKGEQLIFEVEKLLKYGRKNNYPSRESETLQETASRWSEQNMQVERDFFTLVPLFERAKYSAHPLTSEQTESAVESIERIKKRIKEKADR